MSLDDEPLLQRHQLTQESLGGLVDGIMTALAAATLGFSASAAPIIRDAADSGRTKVTYTI